MKYDLHRVHRENQTRAEYCSCLGLWLFSLISIGPDACWHYLSIEQDNISYLIDIEKKLLNLFFQSCLFYLSCIWPCLHVQSPEAKIWRKLSLFQSMSHQPHAQAQGSGSDVLLCHGSGGRQSLELRITYFIFFSVVAFPRIPRPVGGWCRG